MYTLGRDFEEPLTVEKIRPDGYLLLNGHHRWAAAMRMGVRRAPIHIVNLTQTADIQKMLQNAKHDKSVALDLDEVVFASGREMAMEKALPFPARRVYKERLRYGIPALFRFFKSHGYDIWVYTAQYYSMEYIQHLFKWYGVKIDNFVTGILKKTGMMRWKEREYGFRTYQSDAQDDDWKEKIIARADEVKKLIANEQKR